MNERLGQQTLIGVETMLKVTFVVGFDEEGRITQITRNCPIPRPTCEGCKFKKWCDKIEDRIKTL